MPNGLRDKPANIKQLLRNWRVKVSAVVICLNLELVVIPWILIGMFDLSGSELRNAAAIWSSIEMGWWIYFSGWVPRAAEKLKQVADVKEATSELVEEVKEDVEKRIEEFVEEHTVNKFDFDFWKDSKSYIFLITALKAFGYTLGWLFILFISAIPFPGLWIPGLALCRKHGWTFGYSALFLGNFVKNYFYAFIWELIWPYRSYIFLFLGLVAGSVYFYKKYNKFTWKDLLFKVTLYFSKNRKNHE